MKTCACGRQVVPGSEAVDAIARQRVVAVGPNGQSVAPVEAAAERAPSRFTVSVDDRIVELCNEAYEDAERRGSAEVEIAHLVLRFALSAAQRACFETAAVSRVALFDAANHWLAGSARGGTASPPQTSADLKMLLARAEQTGLEEERAYASPSDFLLVLMTRSQDLATARFVRNVRGYADYRPPVRAETRTASLRVREVQLEMELRGPRRELESRARSNDGERVATDVGDRELRGEDGSLRGPNRGGEGSGGRERSSTQQDRGIVAPAQRSPDGAAERGVDRRGALAAREWLRGRSGVGSGRVAFERERQVPEGSPAEHKVLLERLHRQEGQLAELRALLGQVLTQRDDGDEWPGNAGAMLGSRGPGERSLQRPQFSIDGDGGRGSRGRVADGRGRRSGLRWARLRRRDDDDACPLRSSSADAAVGRSSGPRGKAGDIADDLAEPLRRKASSEARDGDQRFRSIRALGDARVVRDSVVSDDALSVAADNDTEDEGGTGERMKRFYLSPDDDIVRAPSIGPRTAARLTPVGLVLVRDLLNCDPEAVAAMVGARYMPAARIAEWRAQARLVCTIPPGCGARTRSCWSALGSTP